MNSAPLHMACLTGNLGCVNLLLAHGARPDSQMHCRSMTPLHCASLGGHDTCVDALLSHTPDGGAALVAIRDSTRRVAAEWAAKRGHAELAARLRAIAGQPGTKRSAKVAPADRYAAPTDATPK